MSLGLILVIILNSVAALAAMGTVWHGGVGLIGIILISLSFCFSWDVFRKQPNSLRHEPIEGRGYARRSIFHR
jgi:hypothetical protein